MSPSRDGVAEGIDHRLHGEGHGADMDRDVVRLRQQPRAGIAQRDGEIARGIQDLGIGGAQHRLPHFLDDGAEAVVEDGERDGIWGGHGREASVAAHMASSLRRRAPVRAIIATNTQGKKPP